MTEEEIKAIAAQLRQPHGEGGTKIAQTMNKGNAYMNLATIKSLNIKDGDTILEIGMGNGFFVKDVLAYGADVHYVGCDFSEKMVEESKVMNEFFVKEGRASFFFTPADVLPMKDASIDKLFTVNTIYFWENRTAVLTEFHRVLKSTGTLTIAIRPKKSMDQYPFTKYGFTKYSKEELVDLLEQNDFKVQSAEEYREPETDFNGQKYKPESVVVTATK